MGSEGSNAPVNMEQLIAQMQKQKEALEQLQSLPGIVQSLKQRLSDNSSQDNLPFEVASVKSQEHHDSDIQSDDGNEFEALMSAAKVDQDNLEDGEIEEGISAILQDVEKDVEYGPALVETVAQSFVKTVSRKLKKETASQLRENVKIPENCKAFLAPKMNKEVWRTLPSHARLEDVRKQQLQSVMSTSLSALAMIADTVTRNSKVIPGPVKAAMLKTAIDAANLLGDQFQDISSRRRMDVRKYISQQYSPLCSKEFGPSEYLFGSDFSEALKSSRNESLLLRRNDSRSHRFVPYKGQRKSFQGAPPAPLNSFRSPSQLPRRGNWSGYSRGKPQEQQNRFHQSNSNQQFSQFRRQF